MSFSLNKQTIIGNLGRDPEIIQRGDFRIGVLNVATTESWKDKATDEWRNLVTWHRVILRNGDVDYAERTSARETPCTSRASPAIELGRTVMSRSASPRKSTHRSCDCTQGLRLVAPMHLLWRVAMPRRLGLRVSLNRMTMSAPKGLPTAATTRLTATLREPSSKGRSCERAA